MTKQEKKVKAYSPLLCEWVVGTVTFQYPNGKLEVQGVDSWEGTRVITEPHLVVEL